MKSVLNFFKNFFEGQKNEYIGLSSFKPVSNKKPEIKKEIKKVETTSLTGLLKRAG